MHLASGRIKLVLRERVKILQTRVRTHIQCNAEQLEFSCAERRHVVAAFDGGAVSSDGGALLLGKVGAAIGLVDGIAKCFLVARPPALIEHSVRTLVGQRVFALALGYEDVNDYEQPRHDSVLGKLYARVRMG